MRRLKSFLRAARSPEYRLNIKIANGRKAGQPVELSEREFRVMLDGMTRRQLNMPGDEFLRRMDRGELPDSDMADYLAQLAGGRVSG